MKNPSQHMVIKCSPGPSDLFCSADKRTALHKITKNVTAVQAGNRQHKLPFTAVQDYLSDGYTYPSPPSLSRLGVLGVGEGVLKGSYTEGRETCTVLSRVGVRCCTQN